MARAGATAHARLRLAVRGSVDVLVEHLPAVTLLLRVRGNSAVEVAALERRRLLDERLARLVRAAVEEGSLRADLDPELVSRLVFGMVNSLVEWYRPDGPIDPTHLADALVDLAFDGLHAQGRIVQDVFVVAGPPEPRRRLGLSGYRLPGRAGAAAELGDHHAVGGAGHGDVVQP